MISLNFELIFQRLYNFVKYVSLFFCPVIITIMVLRKFFSLLTILSLCILPACGTKSNTVPQTVLTQTDHTVSLHVIMNDVTQTPFQPVSPTPTPSFTPTEVPTATFLPTETTVPTSTPEPEPTNLPDEQPAYPDEYFITGIYGHRQTYSISCEASAATDWAKFFGADAYESTIQFHMPLSDNPDFGFVGNVNDPWGQIPPYSYGVHAEPVATALRDLYELPARAEKDFSLDEVKQEIANNQPVLAWVIGNMVDGYPTEYTDSQGNIAIVAPYEHAVVLTGYDSENIRYLNNGNFYEIPNEYFLNSWSVLGNMVVFYHD